MNINLVKTVVLLIASEICILASFISYLKYRKNSNSASLYSAIFALVAALVLIVTMLMVQFKIKKHSQEQVSVETNLDANLVGYFIDIPENLVTINLNETNSAEFTVFLGNSKSQDDTDGFSFSVLDLKRNELRESPIEVTGLKSNGKHSYTVTISAQEEGSYFIRVSHKLAIFSSDVLVIVKTKEEI